MFLLDQITFAAKISVLLTFKALTSMASDKNELMSTNSSVLTLTHKNHPGGLVVQSNTLIDAAYQHTLDEMRLLYIALKKIDRKGGIQPDGIPPEITITAIEYRDAFGIRSHSLHNRLAETADSIFNKPIITYDFNPVKNKIDKTKRAWFTSITYDAEGDASSVRLRFSPELTPFLYELTSNFTKIDFDQLAQLDTPFAMRLFQWLHKYRGLRKSKKENGLFETEPFTVEELKSRTGLIDKYKEFKFFKRDMLEPAINRINAQTNLSVSYRLVKEGRTVKSIVFVFIDDSQTMTSKPFRPRLPSRPKVLKDSNAEGEWARTCIHILEEYSKNLEAYDPKAVMPIRDTEKLISYYQIIGDKLKVKEIEDHLASRRMVKDV
jgi:plasmid replication initiation protein